MANVFRVVKDKNYTVISNEYLRDKNLRLESIGLMTIILSLSPDYKITMESLERLTKENYRTIKLILKELKEYGYVQINKQRDEKGHYYFDYIFFESNRLNPLYNPLYTFYKVDNGTPSVENIDIDNTPPPNNFTTMEKVQGIINTNNTYKINIDKTKLNLCFLTEYLINWNFIPLNDINLFGYDNFLTNFLNDNEDTQLVVKVVNYVCKTIIKNKYLDEEQKPITNLLSYFKASCLSNIKKFDEHLLDDWFD